MKWEKKGLIYEPIKSNWWSKLYGILPTPVFLEELNVLRIYFSTSCADRYGRITYIDLDPDNPGNVLNNPEKIILDIGFDGCFDDCGVNVSSVIKVGNKVFMYYAGYQRHVKTPYSIFSGLAVSDDYIHFERVSNVPVLERTTRETSLRSAPTVLYENGLFKMWYVASQGWQKIEGEIHKGRLMPVYVLKYASSADGINWEASDEPVFPHQDDEFGFGRPYIVKRNNIYQLWYSVRSKSKPYFIGYAESDDCKNWVRKDHDAGIGMSASGWDSNMICYPSIIDLKGNTYLFYNGNNNGESGFGYAKLIEE